MKLYLGNEIIPIPHHRDLPTIFRVEMDSYNHEK